MRRALAVAAKAPQHGKVKTRLHGLLSPDDATELYRCFLADTLSLMDSVPGAEPVISYTPAGAGHLFAPLISDNHRLLAQRGESFGDKLYHALADLLREGFGAAVIMDADSPTLPRHYLARAFEELDRAGDRVVLGPAEDGGYYLIGLKRPHRRLFEDITWSSELVLGQTLARARELGLEVALLPEWYDVDTVAEFERLKREILGGGPGEHPGAARRGNHNGEPASHTRRFILSRWPATGASGR